MFTGRQQAGNADLFFKNDQLKKCSGRHGKNRDGYIEDRHKKSAFRLHILYHLLVHTPSFSDNFNNFFDIFF